MNYHRVAAAIPSVRVADMSYNAEQIKQMIDQAVAKGVDVVCFPELCITGYSCQDLFFNSQLCFKALCCLWEIKDFTEGLPVTAIVGLPINYRGKLFNCAAVITSGKIEGIVAKRYIPNYGEFYEKRWFASGDEIIPGELYFRGEAVKMTNLPQVFETSDGLIFGIEICEDLWVPNPPSTDLSLCGTEVVFNLSATTEVTGKHSYLTQLVKNQSARCLAGYVYCSCGFGESTQDVVFGGNAMIVENGRMLAEAERFSLEPQLIIADIDADIIRYERRHNTSFRGGGEIKHERIKTNSMNVKICRDTSRLIEINRNETEYTPSFFRFIDPHPFAPQGKDMSEAYEEILNIQALGLAKRLKHTNSSHAVIGISGGLDSTLALLITVLAFDKLGLDRKGIVGITMPGFGTTSRTHNNAVDLMSSLGISQKEISISKAVMQHFADIEHDMAVQDVTYENSQARERTQILMDYANQIGGMVIGTGDMSELALGWATYNGDHMSMYGVNAGVPKTLVKSLVKHIADNKMDEKTRETLLDIIDTPISPELIPADENGEIKQKTEDLVGPYELHDFFLYYFLRYGFSPEKIFYVAKLAFKDYEEYTDEVITHWLTTFVRRFFNQQFKRSCMPDGPKVGSVCLSPRGDWRMPSDAVSSEFLNSIKNIY